MIRKTHLLILLLTANFPVGAQEFRDTAVPNSQISAIVRDVAQWHDMQHADCPFVKAAGSEQIEKTSDFSKERWTIIACSGRSFAYQVTVFGSDGGGVTDMVSNLDEPLIGSKASTPSAPGPTACAEMRSEFDALSNVDPGNRDSTRLAQLAADLAVCRPAPDAP